MGRSKLLVKSSANKKPSCHENQPSFRLSSGYSIGKTGALGQVPPPKIKASPHPASKVFRARIGKMKLAFDRALRLMDPSLFDLAVGRKTESRDSIAEKR